MKAAKQASQLASVPALSFNCTAGCGECGVKLQDFVTHQVQEQEGGEWAAVETEPQIVSACCNAPVEVWDERKRRITASIETTRPEYIKAMLAAAQPAQPEQPAQPQVRPISDYPEVQQALLRMAEDGTMNTQGAQPAQPAQPAQKCECPSGAAMECMSLKNCRLNTSPPQRQPLTQSEYMKALGPLRNEIACSAGTLRRAVRAIEAAIGAKP